MTDEICDNIAVGSFAGHFIAANDNIDIGVQVAQRAGRANPKGERLG